VERGEKHFACATLLLKALLADPVALESSQLTKVALFLSPPPPTHNGLAPSSSSSAAESAIRERDGKRERERGRERERARAREMALGAQELTPAVVQQGLTQRSMRERREMAHRTSVSLTHEERVRAHVYCVYHMLCISCI